MKTKQMTAIAIFLAALFTAGSAFAQVRDDLNPGSEEDLYEIYNKIFNKNETSSSNLAILDDDLDNIWTEVGEGFVKITVRYAGYGQELGIEDIDGYKTIASSISGGWQENLSKIIPSTSDFVFVEKLSGNGSGVGPWYSDDRNSPTVDHFVAIDVTDEYNSLPENTRDNIFADCAWLIAFEDLVNGGDWDYNDLVALVVDVDPIITFAEEISFSAESGAGQITLAWSAVSEEDVLGYNILRAQGIFGEYEQINENIIYGIGSIETTVGYEFTDNDVQNGVFYRYKLVEVETDGDTAEHGPAMAIPRLLYRILQ